MPKTPMSAATLGLSVFVASMLSTLALIAVGINVSRRDAPTTAVPTSAIPAQVASAPANTALTPAPARFAPPDDRKIPDTEMGAVIRAGEQIFLRTGLNAKAYVGNSLNCVNCHLDAGRLAGSAPMWGAYPLYPAY
ncbi:MAG: cytochrome C, partial [Polaromonas sp.]|nr:cytochrome C [Polaromonas sp.]